MKAIGLAFVFFFTSLCWAGPVAPSGYEWGNGGFLISCSSESIVGSGVFSVDRIEGEFLHGFKVSEALLGLETEDEIIAEILKRLEILNPTRARTYKKWLLEIMETREFVENFFFMPLPDSSATMIPEGCKQEQAAVFIVSPMTNKVRFLFNKKLWDRAAVIDRAFLLMHELIYREATLPENQHKNSVASRYLNAWIFQGIDKASEIEIIEVLRSLHFKYADYSGLPLVLNARMDLNRPYSVRFAPLIRYPGTNKIKKAVLGPAFSISLGSEIFQRVCNDSFTDFEFQSIVEFFPSGKVKRMYFERDNSVGPIWDTPGFSVTNCNFKGMNYFEFDESGKVLLMEYKPRPILTEEWD